jgi:hypothetical protein
MAQYKDDRYWVDVPSRGPLAAIDAELGIDSGPEPDVHVYCGLTMVGPTGPVPCKCHRYCDPRWCMTAAREADDYNNEGYDD